MRGLLAVTVAVAGLMAAGQGMAGDDDYIQHRDRAVQNMQETITCLKTTTDWDGWKRCHQEAGVREKQRRLAELQEEQRRIQEELRQMQDH